ncbi:HAD-IA family hydrolase [Planosporangium thailandense]|uniref:HAD-IA family hydrolase n=2 Tax=Planosporangium thailandense TaxID=765197 RepID=A0ABX0XQC0_9ACTN|nr:HAD-IA family hydrolase [Planosporangium thailandense]NJC68174.1 HAD-IA family hydrolase [Planosporangium thailandense]
MRGPRQPATALLIDFAGVVYRRDPSASAAVEERHGLPPGTVTDLGAQWGRLRQALAGEVTRAEWLDGIAHALADRVGGLDAARTLAAEAHAHDGEIVPEVLAFVDEVRAAGRRVGLAANAMDDFDAVLARYGLTDHFDVIVNSSAIGIHKPAPEFFTRACLAIETPPERCLFVDDDDRDVRAARAARLSAYRYNGPQDFPYLRAALGL